MVLYLFRNRTCVPSSGYDQELTVIVFVVLLCVTGDVYGVCIYYIFQKLMYL